MKSSRASVVVVGLAAAALVLPAAGAQATPTGCSITPAQWSASATCTGGTGYVTAHVTCSDGNSGDEYHRTGPRVGPGQVSKATCPQKFYISVSDYWYSLSD